MQRLPCRRHCLSPSARLHGIISAIIPIMTDNAKVYARRSPHPKLFTLPPFRWSSGLSALSAHSVSCLRRPNTCSQSQEMPERKCRPPAPVQSDASWEKMSTSSSSGGVRPSSCKALAAIVRPTCLIMLVLLAPIVTATDSARPLCARARPQAHAAARIQQLEA